MQRYDNESFAQYKARRTNANNAVRRLNAASKGGSGNPRADRMDKGGQYGKMLASHFAKQRATHARLMTHKSHVAKIAARTAKRAAANDAARLQAA